MDSVIAKLFSPGKGILANDASVATLTARFTKYGLEPSLENRNAFRKIFYSTPEVQQYISGVILNEEAMQFALLLAQQGILPGVKVDKGLMTYGSEGKEYITTGSKDLDFRLQDHKSEGARFTKWRAAFVISSNTPTETAISENIRQLVEFAKISLSNDLVPIVEPEVLMEGAHSITQTAEISKKILSRLFENLDQQEIPIDKIILKTNMAVPGSSHEPANSGDIGKATVEMLCSVVPKNIGGVVFLSGGQTAEEAIENLRAICSLKSQIPFPMTFSFERVFEEPVLNVWSKDTNNIELPQQVFLEVAKKAGEVLHLDSSLRSE